MRINDYVIVKTSVEKILQGVSMMTPEYYKQTKETIMKKASAYGTNVWEYRVQYRDAMGVVTDLVATRNGRIEGTTQLTVWKIKTQREKEILEIIKETLGYGLITNMKKIRNELMKIRNEDSKKQMPIMNWATDNRTGYNWGFDDVATMLSIKIGKIKRQTNQCVEAVGASMLLGTAAVKELLKVKKHFNKSLKLTATYLTVGGLCKTLSNDAYTARISKIKWEELEGVKWSWIKENQK